MNMDKHRYRAPFFVIGALLILLLLSACNSHTERPVDFQGEYQYGQQLYVEFCAECHQTDGTGYSSLFPRLAGNPIVNLTDPSPVVETVVYGQGSMMAFNEKLTSNEIAAILTYIRNSWGNHAPGVSPHQVH